MTLATERTFLAWARTALALIGGGLAADQAVHFSFGGVRLFIGVPAVVLGGVIGVASFRRSQANQRAATWRANRLVDPFRDPGWRITGLGLIIAALVALGGAGGVGRGLLTETTGREVGELVDVSWHARVTFAAPVGDLESVVTNASGGQGCSTVSGSRTWSGGRR